MISPDSQGGPNIAVITLICGWTFLAIALILVAFVLWFRRQELRLDDCLTFLALATSIALIVQTTWAIVDEGQDDHEVELSKTKFALVLRVGQSASALSRIY